MPVVCWKIKKKVIGLRNGSSLYYDTVLFKVCKSVIGCHSSFPHHLTGGPQEFIPFASLLTEMIFPSVTTPNCPNFQSSDRVSCFFSLPTSMLFPGVHVLWLSISSELIFPSVTTPNCSKFRTVIGCVPFSPPTSSRYLEMVFLDFLFRPIWPCLQSPHQIVQKTCTAALGCSFSLTHQRAVGLWEATGGTWFAPCLWIRVQNGKTGIQQCPFPSFWLQFSLKLYILSWLLFISRRVLPYLWLQFFLKFYSAT